MDFFQTLIAYLYSKYLTHACQKPAAFEVFSKFANKKTAKIGLLEKKGENKQIKPNRIEQLNGLHNFLNTIKKHI